MNKQLITYDLGFALSFDIERDPKRTSGFRPAYTGWNSGLVQFAESALRGLASALRVGFIQHLVIVGGDESRYPGVNRAQAIQRMLVLDLGIDEEMVESISSELNTEGNVKAIKEYMSVHGLQQDGVALIGRHYHLPRATLLLAREGIQMEAFPAESLWLLDQGTEEELITLLGGGPLAAQLAGQIRGIADLIRGNYKPRRASGSTT